MAIIAGRMTADAAEGTVCFLIGMRFNRPWKVRSWLPVFVAMPKMLRELDRQPELGLLKASMFCSGLTIMTVQYWRSVEQLNAYASARDQAHLPAWREFNRRVKDNSAVGVFHETYVLREFETIYVNMPAHVGLAGAAGMVPVGRRGQRALHRLDASVPDTPSVEPY